MREVAGRLQLGQFDCPVITVAGTNGKGSCVALMEAMLDAQGYRVCAYTSPHILHYNERIRIAGEQATDTQLCEAFSAIEAVRGDVPLTYFEFSTLAALRLFQASRPQVILLEVGLGGRLDAVNLVDADLALISSIGIDHTEWLGSDRESIGLEKAGIFRPRQLAVCGDPQPPLGLLQYAADEGVDLHCYGRDFHDLRPDVAGQWDWQGWDSKLQQLPAPALPGEIQRRNAAVCIAGLVLLGRKLVITEPAIRCGLQDVRLPGRFQWLAGDISIILDVAHNPEACAVLARNLQSAPCEGRTLAVLGMLEGKPADEVARIMDAQVHAWYLGGLHACTRAQSAENLARKLGPLNGSHNCYPDIASAFAAARQAAGPGDRIVVFGSFQTVEAVLRIAA